MITAPMPPTDQRAPPPRKTTLVAGLALMIFLAYGLLSTTYSMIKGLDLFPARPTVKTVMDGTVMRGISESLSQASFPQMAATSERAGTWLLLRDLGPQVKRGCDNWLFLAEELQQAPNAQQYMQSRARTALQLRAALEKRGIALLLVMVPDKSRIEQAHLCNLTRPRALAGRLQEWTATMRARGMQVVDLTIILSALASAGSEPFYRTDTHWNESGALAVSLEVAKTVQRMGQPLTPHREYDSTLLGPLVRPGDLVHLAGLDSLWQALQPKMETVTSSVIVERGPATGSSSAVDLFGDANLPTVALIGTSYSRNANFANFLSGSLQTPVANFSRDGGNFLGAARIYFQSPAFLENPPKLVIWEIPERTLQMPGDADVSINVATSSGTR